MTMYRRAITPGSVRDFTTDEITESGAPDSMVLCHACNRIIPSRLNLVRGTACPFCHHDVSETLGDNILGEDTLFDEGDTIALPC